MDDKTKHIHIDGVLSKPGGTITEDEMDNVVDDLIELFESKGYSFEGFSFGAGFSLEED